MYALRDEAVGFALQVVCPATGRVLPTVMRATPEQFLALDSASYLICPDCGREHAWRALRPHLAGDNPFR